MNLKHFLVLSTCVIGIASVFATILTINLAPAQDRRQDRRQDRDPNRNNVHCELGGFNNRTNARVDSTLEEADQSCRKGDTIILSSPVLVARLCDFSWSIVRTGSSTTVCVFGGVRELR
jgi:hypothetical protein